MARRHVRPARSAQISLGSDDRLTFAHPRLGIGIKHDIKHVVSVPLKSNGSPLAGHVDLMPGPGRLQTRDGDEAARAENWRARPGDQRNRARLDHPCRSVQKQPDP